MKKQAGFICIFFLLLCMPTVLNFLSVNQNNEITENRSLNEKPAINLSSYFDYPQKYNSWYNDHFPFRSKIIEISSLINFYLFHRDDTSNTIVGNNNWLFYTDNNYKGINKLTDIDFEIWKNKLENFQAICDQNNAVFAFVIGPDKEQVYEEKFPDYIKKIDEYSMGESLYNYLKSNTNIKVFYPKNLFIAKKDSQPMYFQTDTHWNECGAYYSIEEVLKNTGFLLSESQPVLENKSNHGGDLAGLLNLQNYLHEFNHCMIVNNDDISYSITAPNKKWNYSITDSSQKENVLMIIGDSFFGNQVISIPIFAQNFNKVYYFHLSESMLPEEFTNMFFELKPDLLIFETVERNINFAMNINFF